MSDAPISKTSSDKITVRFGDVLLQEGHTAVPNLVMNHYAKLGISPTEMLFIIHVWQFWWTEKNAYPALPTIAKRMDMSDRQIQNYVKSLKDLRYLEDVDLRILEVRERYEKGRGQTTNEFDFSGLLRAILLLHEEKTLTLVNPRKTKIKTGVKDSSPGTPVNDFSPPPVKYTSPEEDEEQEDEDLFPEIPEGTPSKYKIVDNALSQPVIQADSSLAGKGNPARSYPQTTSTQHKPTTSDRHTDNGAAGEENSDRVGKPVVHHGVEHIGDVMSRLKADETSTAAVITQQPVAGKRRGRPKRPLPQIPPDQYDNLDRLIRDYSRTLGNYDEVESNITQAVNLMVEKRIDFNTFYMYAVEGKRAVLKAVRVQNRMAWWYTWMKNNIPNPKDRQSNPTLHY